MTTKEKGGKSPPVFCYFTWPDIPRQRLGYEVWARYEDGSVKFISLRRSKREAVMLKEKYNKNLPNRQSS